MRPNKPSTAGQLPVAGACPEPKAQPLASNRLSLKTEANIMSNIFKTTLLLTGMTLLLMLAGRAFGGQNGMLMALDFAAVLNFLPYFSPDKLALPPYRAHPVGRDDLPRVYNIVERLSQKVSLPMPKVYLIPTDSPNAFATGRNPNHASVT